MPWLCPEKNSGGGDFPTKIPAAEEKKGAMMLVFVAKNL